MKLKVSNIRLTIFIKRMRIFFSTILFLLSFSILSQINFCGDSFLLNKNNAENELLYKRYATKNELRFSQSVTLPVVIHIIHDNGDENISDTQVAQGIAWLNAAFANQNPYYNASGEDSQIKFCLATRGPDGRPTTGINRVQSALTNYDYTGIDKDLKSLSIWAPSDYINIWVINNVSMYGNSSIAGYANQPSAAGTVVDGIVMEAGYFGSTTAANSVLIHEIGHYLGLHHTFFGGCKNNDCLVDGDKVCDTPPDDAGFFDFCSNNVRYNSCITDEDDASVNNPFRNKALGGLGDQSDLENNFMDYIDQKCRNQFSNGQIKRMQFFLQGPRKSLTFSKGCSTPCIDVAIANFEINKLIFEAGENIIINNTSSTTCSYSWFINKKLFSNTYIPNLSNLMVGQNTLKLIVDRNDTNCEKDSIEKSFEITCKIQANLIFLNKGNTIIFENKSINQNSIEFKIIRNNTTIYNSIRNKDSIILSPDNYTLCLVAYGTYCKDSICKSFTIFAMGKELCDNSLDDDSDGFVDLFDSDCLCAEDSYNGGCRVNCEFLPDAFEKIKMKMKWKSSRVDIESGNYTNFAIGNNKIYTPYTEGKVFNLKNGIEILEAASGITIKKFQTDTLKSGFPVIKHILILDIEKDGMIDIFFKDNLNGLLSYKDSGLKKWRTGYFKYYTEQSYPQSIDFNLDGLPEVYFANKIINSQSGKLLFDGKSSYGRLQHPYEYFGYGAHSIAGDLTSHFGLELAAGNSVYEVTFNNLVDTLGNEIKVLSAPANVSDGATSIADINLDGKIDVIVNKGANFDEGGGLWVWDPRSLKVIAQVEFKKSLTFPGMSGGIPFIGNIDEDCFPEIGVTYVNELRIYKFDGSQQLKLMYTLPTSDKSGITGISMFDFNQDGKNELIYRDETFLRIIEGKTGVILDSFEIHSYTGAECPIIADIDDDGQAEILVNGFLPNEPNSIRIFCFESATAPWAPARKVWNQTGYHITNVNDDLTIPRYPQNNAAFFDTDSCAQMTCNQPYNSFMAQATFRTQNGCVKWPAVDLSIEAIKYECSSDSLIFFLKVKNNSDTELLIDTATILAYARIPDMTASPLYKIKWKFLRDAAGKVLLNDNIRLAMPMPAFDVKTMLFRINTPGVVSAFENIKGLTEILECDYENNSDIIDIDITKKNLDLGPDIIKCPTTVFTLYAGNNFTTYQWSDGSQDSVFTSSFIGVHGVTVTDGCGRKYSDEVEYKNDPQAKENIGSDLSKCTKDLITYDINGDYDWIKWLPKEAVDCDTCKNMKVISDTSFLLVLVSSKKGCILADSAFIEIRHPALVTKPVSLCSGDSILFYNKYYNKTGMYEHEVGRCDSTITLNLKVLASSITSKKLSLCNGDSLFFLDKWYKENTSKRITLKNQNNCDSVIDFELKFIDTLKSLQKYILCKGDSIKVNNKWLKDDGNYEFKFLSSKGCDSLQTIELKVQPIFLTPFSASFCKGDSIFIGNKWLKEEGSTLIKLKSINGCDSIINYTLKHYPSPITTLSKMLCEGDSIKLFDKFVKQTGVYSNVSKTVTGCDSTTNITLAYYPLASSTQSYTICQGDSIFIANKWLKDVGNNIVKLKSKNGCDSTINVSIFNYPQVVTAVISTLCKGDSIKINNTWIKTEGTFTEKYISSKGCDSLVNRTLVFTQLVMESKNIDLCEGDSIFIESKWIKQAGTYMDTIVSAQACKKILITKVNIITTSSRSVDYILCPDGSIDIGGALIDTSGVYSFKNKNKQGCDTIFIAKVAQLTWPAPPKIDIDCKESLYNASIDVKDPWLYKWSNGDIGLMTQLENGGLLSIKVFTSSGCEKTYSYSLPEIPSVDDIPSFQDVTITSGTYPLQVDLDPKQWKIKWSPSLFVTCDTCFSTTINSSIDTEINIVLTHASGCSFTKGFRIDLVSKPIIIFPNIFCPTCNTNKEWLINFPDSYKILDLYIYDRWGSKVASFENTSSISWDGSINGKTLIPGVYVYKMRYVDNKGFLSLKVSDITIIR